MTNVDWVGLALDLEEQAKRVESQTAQRAMLAGANGLRLMGADFESGKRQREHAEKAIACELRLEG